MARKGRNHSFWETIDVCNDILDCEDESGKTFYEKLELFLTKRTEVFGIIEREVNEEETPGIRGQYYRFVELISHEQLYAE